MGKKPKQPKEMYFLSLIEMCQRFALWGIGNLLVLYTITYFNFTDQAAAHLYGLFSGLAFIMPLIGGYISDRTNYKTSIIIGSLLLTIGCFFMAIGTFSLLYLALFFVAIGTGIFTPSIYAILAFLYREKESLRDGGFSIYYAAVNIGVFLGTFILGSLGQASYWSLAFFIAAIVQLIGLSLFIYTIKKPAFSHLHHKIGYNSKKPPAPSVKKIQKDRILVIFILSTLSILFWMTYNQGWSSMSIFALKFMEKKVGNFPILPSWILSLESLYLVVLAFPLAWLYSFLSKRKIDPSPIMKTVLGLFAIGVCFFIMSIGSKSIPSHALSATVTPLYPITAYFLMAIGEMLIAPIGLSLVTKLSPKNYTARFVGVWYLCIGVAYYLGGLIGGYITHVSSITYFFQTIILIVWIPALILLFFVKKLSRMTHPKAL